MADCRHVPIVREGVQIMVCARCAKPIAPRRRRAGRLIGAVDVGAMRDAIRSEPAVRALGALAALLIPETAKTLRTVDEILPDLVDELNAQAVDVVRKEADALDRELANGLAGAVDELLTGLKRRVAKSHRLPPAKKKSAKRR